MSFYHLRNCWVVGEKLLLAAEKAAFSGMSGEKAASQLEVIPFSINTASHRIAEMATDVKEQSLENVHSRTWHEHQNYELTRQPHSSFGTGSAQPGSRRDQTKKRQLQYSPGLNINY